MKYRVLFDYYSEGMKLQDEEFDTVDDAVKWAVGNSNGSPFFIIRIIDWSADEPLISNK